MPRFSSVREFDEWRRSQGLTPVREATPQQETSVPPERTLAEHATASPLESSAASDASQELPLSSTTDTTMSAPMSMDSKMSGSRPTFGLSKLGKLGPALTWILAACSLIILWYLFSPFLLGITTWIGNNIALLGILLAVTAFCGYMTVLYQRVHEELPQEILTLRADVMRRLDQLESPAPTSTPTSNTPQYSGGQPTTIQKEFAQWMQDTHDPDSPPQS